MPKANKSTVGVFFGSKSPEHDVSIITATEVIRSLREAGFWVVPVYIAKDGRLFLGPDTDDPQEETLSHVSYFKNNLIDKLSKLPEYDLALSDNQNHLRFQEKTMLTTTTVDIDMAFPCFHGPHGEDGALHGLFELSNIPVVGCGRQASTVAMDKALTKLLYRQFDIPTTEFIYFTLGEWEDYQDKILSDLKYLKQPLFVKPARAGSSIGITRVTSEDELIFAIEVALNYDTKVVVEEGIENVADITISLLGNEHPETSLIQESRFASDFFSYEDKYISEGGAQIGGADKRVIIPADIPDKVEEKVTELAVDIFMQFELSGIARVDFLYDRDDQAIYANEINTLPGTLYRRLWEESGLSFPELLRRLIRSAKQKHQTQEKITHTFDSPILDYAGEGKLSSKAASEPEDQEGS